MRLSDRQSSGIAMQDCLTGEWMSNTRFWGRFKKKQSNLSKQRSWPQCTFAPFYNFKRRNGSIELSPYKNGGFSNLTLKVVVQMSHVTFVRAGWQLGRVSKSRPRIQWVPLILDAVTAHDSGTERKTFPRVKGVQDNGALYPNAHPRAFLLPVFFPFPTKAVQRCL